MQVSATNYFFRDYIVLTLGNEERIPLRMNLSLANKLRLKERFPQSFEQFPAWARDDREPNFDTLSESFFESQRRKPE